MLENKNNELDGDQNVGGAGTGEEAGGGAADNNDNESGAKESNPSGTDREAKGKTFTQSQVSRMMAREKNQGRNAVYKELGLDPKDTKSINMLKALLESQKTEEQKVSEQAVAEQAALEEANDRAAKAEAKAEAMMLGVKPQFVEDAVTLVLAKTGSEETDVKTALGELKTKYPIWFGQSNEEGDKKDNKDNVGQRGTGSSIKSSKSAGKKSGEQSLGSRLAAKRVGAKSKTSYWS